MADWTLDNLKTALGTLENDPNFSGELPVYVSSDPEGNAIRTIWTVQIEPMIEGHPIAVEDIGTEYDEGDVTYGVVIWPGARVDS